MNKNNVRFAAIGMILVMSACNLSGQPATEVVGGTIVTDVPDSTTASVQHVNIPGELPPEKIKAAKDQDSSFTAYENRAEGGDRFTFSRYERPFNSTTMDVYFPDLDILVTEYYQDDTWFYGVLTFKLDKSNQSFSGNYGLEIDLNVDGGGDWLFLAAQPSSTEWTTNGVQAWFDDNDDVGGQIIGKADDTNPNSNGFETKVFDDGQGDDPDLAWVRISPSDPNVIQIAVKQSALGGDTSFMAGMWAGHDALDPALFDIHDTFTHDQAGSPLKEFVNYYPIKEVYELDNACRIAVGFQPTGNEPGICPWNESPPEGPPDDSCPPGEILWCNSDGSCYCLGPQG